MYLVKKERKKERTIKIQKNNLTAKKGQLFTEYNT